MFTAEINELINSSLASGNPILLAAADTDGQPILSYRGSIHTFSDTQLGLWIRHAVGSTIDAIQGNANVALMYRSDTVPMLQFQGRARIVDGSDRDRIFDLSPEVERAADPDRTGVAIMIDIDRVNGVILVQDGQREHVSITRTETQ